MSEMQKISLLACVRPTCQKAGRDAGVAARDAKKKLTTNWHCQARPRTTRYYHVLLQPPPLHVDPLVISLFYYFTNLLFYYFTPHSTAIADVWGWQPAMQKVYHVLPRTAAYYHVLPRTSMYYQVLPSTITYYHVLSHTTTTI